MQLQSVPVTPVPITQVLQQKTVAASASSSSNPSGLRAAHFGASQQPSYPAWLATDGDGTYIAKGKPEAQTQLNKFVQQMNAEGKLGLILTTGRGREYYQHARTLQEVPEAPDFYILGDGRYIYRGKPPNQGTLDADWEQKLANYNEPKALQIFADASKELGLDFQAFLDAFPQNIPLEYFRPADGQVSRYVHITPETIQSQYGSVDHFLSQTKEKLEAMVKKAGIEATVLALAYEEPDYYIFRIKPTLATKEDSLEFLMEKLGLNPDEVIIAGDNYNDLGMLQRARRAILSGNKPSLQGLREEVTQSFQQRLQEKAASRLYRTDQHLEDTSILNGLKHHLSQMQLLG
ncbi:MAG: HAD family hydrolase [Candidatus Melainabacteria bacterium]|nr:HAD family hydrolase [Candidatus Melainabacteria bacterium]